MQTEQTKETTETTKISKKEVPLPENIDKKEKAKNIAIKTLAVIGLAGILALISYGIVKFAPAGIKSISSAAVSLTSKVVPPKKNILTLTTDKYTVNSQEAFTLSWANTATDAGSYTISYPCMNGLSFETPQEGADTNTLACDTQYRFLDNEKSITLTAFSTKNRYLDVPITLNFIKTGNEDAISSSTVTIGISNNSIANEGNIIISSPTITPTTTKITPRAIPQKQTYYPPAPIQPVSYPVTTAVSQTENPNGFPDLLVTVLSTGVIDPGTNSFVSKPIIATNEKAAVRFEVKNIGNKRSLPWKVQSVLPTKTNYTFNSPEEIPLMPGDSIQFTLAFDQFQNTSILQFTLVADPDNRVVESNEQNNQANVAIRVNY